jgi:hypothetical protein
VSESAAAGAVGGLPASRGGPLDTDVQAAADAAAAGDSGTGAGASKKRRKRKQAAKAAKALSAAKEQTNDTGWLGATLSGATWRSTAWFIGGVAAGALAAGCLVETMMLARHGRSNLGLGTLVSKWLVAAATAKQIARSSHSAPEM